MDFLFFLDLALAGTSSAMRGLLHLSPRMNPTTAAILPDMPGNRLGCNLSLSAGMAVSIFQGQYGSKEKKKRGLCWNMRLPRSPSDFRRTTT